MFWIGIFWLCAAFLAYTFVGYPLLLALVAQRRKVSHRRAPLQPTVTVIIPAHNEAARIARKIENTLALDYPEDRREIFVVSDGSNDETLAVARQYESRGVRCLELKERKGKHHAQWLALQASHGEIVVFTDCSADLDRDALSKIVANFADPTVGCVSSEDEVLSDKVPWAGERIYVQLEMALRRLEARAGSLVGVSGSFFAARREICDAWHTTMSSDFFLPLHAAEKGLRTVVDLECRGRYGVVRSERDELTRKVRTIVHGLDVLFLHAHLLNPFRYGFFAVQLASHKLFRWLVPFAALGLLGSSIALHDAGAIYRLALLAQAVVHGGGLLSLLLNPGSVLKLLRPAGFFLLGSAATVMAWMYYLSGERFVIWQPSRRT
ncbi:MAG: glycosyltransferase family 2 protein [Firmicutes bacterium]|nr:glycosyltransferase family 2 protein [Bacillota bacterium]